MFFLPLTSHVLRCLYFAAYSVSILSMAQIYYSINNKLLVLSGMCNELMPVNPHVRRPVSRIVNSQTSHEVKYVEYVNK
jgi:hypothetical protein